jgi:hypothetical protein
MASHQRRYQSSALSTSNLIHQLVYIILFSKQSFLLLVVPSLTYTILLIVKDYYLNLDAFYLFIHMYIF